MDGQSPVVIAVLLGAIFGVLSASLSKALRYQAPDECKWVVLGGDGEDVALKCSLRTINSELENTNFSVIQPQHTVRLRLECSDVLFFQSSLSAGSFRPLQELRDLAIEFCKIGNLSAGAFKGLRQLRNLTLRTHNTDWTAMTLDVDRDAFGGDLALLERLDLGENNMWSLPVGVFCSLHNLEVLNLTRNRLRDVARFQFGLGAASSPDISDRCGANLRTLDLSNNSVDALPSSAFSGLSRLQTLNLQGNAISFVADRALEGVTSLTTLHLSDNKLVSLPPELFSDARDIKEVYLRNNSINVLAPGLFNDLTQLLVLDLSSNELTAEWVNGATFTGLLRLVVLDLSHNRIAKLDGAVFRDLYSLQILRLEDNLIEVVPDNTFSSLYNLHTLILSGNKLSFIDSSTFDGLYVLSLLSLDNNAIQSVHSAALRNSSSLQDLHLNGNKLVTVPPALANLPQLKTLDLGENHISDIVNSSFSDLQQLFGLRLTDNNIGNISKGTFDRMSALKILNLSRNKVHGIEPGAFDNNVNLQAVRLDGNYLTEIGGLFNKLQRLIWLNISDNQMEWFDYALIPTGLQWLDIHANKIKELGNYFEIESQLHLSTFDASYNKLTEVTGSAIPDSVELLFLNDNLISKVQSYTFFKKPNLTRVELNRNRITSLNPNSLRISAVPGTRNIPEFYIGENPFLCDCTMEWLQRINVDNRIARNQPNIMDLNSIYCELLYNRGRKYIVLVEATAEQFMCQYDFHCFALCHCCDFDACDCKMTCPRNCTCYHDQAWKSNAVHCANAGYVGKLPEQIPMDATQLYLDGNDLGSVGSHAFIGRKRLKVLFLNNSNIDSIHNRTFNGLKDLELLHLENNKITELRGFEFEGLDSLKELYLQRNLITSIHNSTFQPLKQLAVLKLDHNRIVHFRLFSFPNTLTEITLAYNSWSCTCDFIESFRDYVQKIDAVISDLSQLRCAYHGGNRTDDDEDYGVAKETDGFYILSDNSSTCFGGLDLNQTATGNFSLTKTIIQRQAVQDYIPLLASTLLVSLLVVSLALATFVFRQELRVWFHSRFGIRLFQRAAATEREDRDKLFDAFVSYSSKDEAFVAEELAPALEHGDPPYKLCLHYRDFPVGAYIGETIVQAVESSRRTIMVLSDNFIRSEWCRFEFKSAHHQVLRDRRRRLIVVLLGDVPHKDLDPDIRLYLKTNTYLQWGDKLFWEKLRFALPDVPNNQRSSSRSTAVALQPARHRHVHRHNNAAPRAVAIHI